MSNQENNPNKSPLNPFNKGLYNPLSALWDGRCTISKYEEVTDPTTHQTKEDLVVYAENEPCRLSHKPNTVVNDMTDLATQSKTISLILRADLEIPAGCVIEVTQYNVTNKYKNSSIPSVYFTHQEIELNVYDDKA